jgi:hypothetical protein
MGKRSVKAKEVLADIRAGITDLDMMEKYQLSAKGLQSLFDKMVAAKLLTEDEIQDRMSTWLDTIAIDLDALHPHEE